MKIEKGIVMEVDSGENAVVKFMAGVYAWMSIGLIVTGLVAFQSAASGLIDVIVQSSGIFYALLLVELVLVYILRAMVKKISLFAASTMFLVYAAMNGVTLSSIFLVYAKTSIISTFFICSVTFAVLSVYGLITKKDLTSWGSFLFMGLIGLIIAMVVNMFLGSPAINFAISCVGILVFLGLTAYDTQMLKEMGSGAVSGSGISKKASIMGALTLYLNFINLFLFILRLFGIQTPSRD